MHCPDCGESIDDDSRYCRACGAEVTPTEDGITEGESSGISGFRRAVYWGGRIGQVALVAVAAILVLGSLMGGMNVLQFAAIGVFALVLFGGVGAVEFLLIRPLS